MSTAAPRPNVLLICTDQQRFDALGAVNAELDTPHLDRLAAEGARFTHCFVQAPVCAPSRASLMTGCYPHDHGLWANGVGLPPGTRLLPAAMAAAGYDCGLVGKWHLDACSDGRTEPCPPGFRVWQWAHDPYPGSSENAYHRWLADAHPDVHDRLFGRGADGRRRSPGRAGVAGSEIDVVPTRAHYSHWVGEQAIRYLRDGRPDDRPFFLVANFFDPHHSFGAPAEYRDRYTAETLAGPVTTSDELAAKPAIFTEASAKSYAGHAPGFADYTAAELAEIRANYYAMVSLVDDEVGRILAALDAQGLGKDTIVIFTSDHGEMLGDHQLLLKGPMMYDCAVRVPLILRAPGIVPAGTVVHELVEWIDLTSTIAGLAGAALPRAQGASLLGLATGTADRHRGWALCEYRDSGHPYDPAVHTTMIRTAETKIVLHHGPPATARDRTGELYDLASDPDELVNLWDDPAHSDLRRAMTEFALDVLVATENRSQPRVAVW